MRDETRIALKLFVEKTHELYASGFVKFMQEHGGTSLNYSYHRDAGVQVEYARPDRDATKAFVGTLRLFLHKSEHFSFRWLANHVLDDDGLSETWKQEFVRARESLNAFLDSKTTINERVVGQVKDDKGELQHVDYEYRPTYRDILDIFDNGDLSHVEIPKKLIYERWKSNPLGGFQWMQWEFDNMLERVLRHINYVAHLSRQELTNQGIEPPAA